jgi:CheY-like chemotaxis protein
MTASASAAGVERSVLVIEDDQQFRSFLRELLQGEGFRVLEAEDGEQGWERLLAESPDVVLTDIVMPGKEGVELIQQIRARGLSLPVVAMSGGNMGFGERYLDVAGILGANATLNKPFSSGELLATLEHVLAGGEDGAG